MNEVELRILLDHLFKHRRIFIKQYLEIESTLSNSAFYDKDKLEK
jgi:hypothetical protein